MFSFLLRMYQFVLSINTKKVHGFVSPVFQDLRYQRLQACPGSNAKQ
jgi:hypothetical protein